jgi:N-acetylneuraminate synthase
VAAKNLTPGVTLTADLVVAKRPDGGISPVRFEDVIGKKTRTALQEDQQISWKDLD